MVSAVNQTLSASVIVRPSGCRYTAPISKSSRDRPNSPALSMVMQSLPRREDETRIRHRRGDDGGSEPVLDRGAPARCTSAEVATSSTFRIHVRERATQRPDLVGGVTRDREARVIVDLREPGQHIFGREFLPEGH